MVLNHSISKSGWSMNLQAHWEKLLPGFPIVQWDERTKYHPADLGLEPLLEKA